MRLFWKSAYGNPYTVYKLKVLNFRYKNFRVHSQFFFDTKMSSIILSININKDIVFTKTFMKLVIKMFYLWNITFISKNSFFLQKAYNKQSCYMYNAAKQKYHPSIIIKTHFHIKNLCKECVGKVFIIIWKIKKIILYNTTNLYNFILNIHKVIRY